MSLAPAALAAVAIAAPGVWFAFSLDRGADPDTVRAANFIYVYERLGHHLTIEKMQGQFIARFAILAAIFLALRWSVRNSPSARNLSAFVVGTILIAAVGVVLSVVGMFRPEWAAPLLRFYWFRLADIGVPLGVALLLGVRTVSLLETQPRRGNAWLAGVLALCLLHLGALLFERRPGGDFWQVAPADAKLKISLDDDRTIVAAANWQGICRYFVNHPGISPAAKVLTPRAAHTFKWHAGLPEIGNWKDVPQDAASIVAWMERMTTIHANRNPAFPERRWARSLTELGEEELLRVARKYGASFVVTEAEPRLNLPLPYANKSYAVYAIPTERPQ